MIICWIGNNDVLSTATSFTNLNASQLTSLAEFESDYIQLVNRFEELVTTRGSKIVFANIPNVTYIGFLLDRAKAEAILGFPVNLPDGHFTSIISVILMGIMGNDNLMGDPDLVLNVNEVATVLARVNAFNAIIAREAARINMPVVDVNTKFAEWAINPPEFFGYTLGSHCKEECSALTVPTLQT